MSCLSTGVDSLKHCAHVLANKHLDIEEIDLATFFFIKTFLYFTISHIYDIRL